MSLGKYFEFKERLEKLSCESQQNIQPTLSHLLHLIQCENVADEYYRKYKAEMKKWKGNIIAEIERSIKECEVQE